MKLNWDPKNVAAFLQTEPVLPHPEATEFVYTFPVDGATGCLRVFPFGSHVNLSLTAPAADEALASWYFDCAAIRINEEIPEEGGPVLVIVAPSSGAGQSWITIAPMGDVFAIGTFFRATPL